MYTPESKIFSFLLQQNGQRLWQVFPARQGQLPVWSSSEAWRCMLLTWATQGWFLEFRMTPRKILSELWRWHRTISQNFPRKENELKDHKKVVHIKILGIRLLKNFWMPKTYKWVPLRTTHFPQLFHDIKKLVSKNYLCISIHLTFRLISLLG